jgi:hypothetical protein
MTTVLRGHEPQIFTGQRGAILRVLLDNRGKQVLGEFRLTACPGETPALFAEAVQ